MLAICMGAIVTSATFAVPVFARRMELLPHASGSCQHEEQSDASDRGLPETGSSRMPPITWDIILSPEQAAMKAAIEEDLPAMGGTVRRLPLSWPRLPGFSCDAAEIQSLLGMIYSDRPELSVYTNGQRTTAESTVFLGAYRISTGDTATADEKMGEHAAVTAAVDDIVSEIDEEMDPGDGAESMALLGARDLPERTGHEEDYLYATWAETKLIQRCSYSDGIDDTQHDNDIYGALVEGESKCYGMSCALKAILDRRHIPSFVATGYLHGDESSRHAVTVLWVEGGWHVMDATGPRRDSLPEHIGWHLASVLVHKGCYGMVVSAPCLVHDFEGPLGEMVAKFDDYVDQHELVLDDRCVELMAAYESLIGA